MNILIIGATSGIGREIWQHYVTDGNTVAITARRADLLNDMAESYPDNTIAAAGDIADTIAFTATLDSIITRLGIIDLAIVCAGIGELNP